MIKFLIDDDETAKIRVIGWKRRRVLGCKNSHVISFFPDGHSIKKWLTIKYFMEADESDGDGEADVEEEEEEEVTWVDAVEADDKYALIEEV